MAAPETLADSSVGRSKTGRVHTSAATPPSVVCRRSPGTAAPTPGPPPSTISRALVLEAAFNPINGNSIFRYALSGLGHAPDVSTVPQLSTAHARVVLRKSLVADLVKCPTLGAVAK
jgi:hypothetical protein